MSYVHPDIGREWSWNDVYHIYSFKDSDIHCSSKEVAQETTKPTHKPTHLPSRKAKKFQGRRGTGKPLNQRGVRTSQPQPPKKQEKEEEGYPFVIHRSFCMLLLPLLSSLLVCLSVWLFVCLSVVCLSCLISLSVCFIVYRLVGWLASSPFCRKEELLGKGPQNCRTIHFGPFQL